MRKISAHYVFTATGSILKNGIVVTDNSGKIVDIIDNNGVTREYAGVEFYNGIITPGFINTHCHLELSHLKGTFHEKEGLPAFIKHITSRDKNDEKSAAKEAYRADNEMYRNGIVAVGDISNSDASFPIKKNSKIFYHTFIEAIGFSPKHAEEHFSNSKKLLSLAVKSGLSGSISPHAPYSVSEKLLKLIKTHSEKTGHIISMHNQESNAENDLFIRKQGEIAKYLSYTIQNSLSSFAASGKSSFLTIEKLLPRKNNLLLVHNIYTGKKEIDIIKKSRKNRVWLVICPNSNLFIEDQLPDITLFRANGMQLCLGTDSYSSNHQLSILSEMKTLHSIFPEIPLNELIQWSSINGARAIGVNEWAGSIEIGKKPGLNVISGLDLQLLKVLPRSKVHRLI